MNRLSSAQIQTIMQDLDVAYHLGRWYEAATTQKGWSRRWDADSEVNRRFNLLDTIQECLEKHSQEEETKCP